MEWKILLQGMVIFHILLSQTITPKIRLGLVSWLHRKIFSGILMHNRHIDTLKSFRTGYDDVIYNHIILAFLHFHNTTTPSMRSVTLMLLMYFNHILHVLYAGYKTVLAYSKTHNYWRVAIFFARRGLNGCLGRLGHACRVLLGRGNHVHNPDLVGTKGIMVL